MKDEFKKEIVLFVDALRSFDVGENRFNPWSMSDDSDSTDAPEKRCNNLLHYLEDHKNSDFILIGESPSTGARYTGIAMTSERIMNKWGEGYQCTSVNGNLPESTATMVWEEISKHKDKSFVLWNAYAFNAKAKEGKRNYRCGSEKEIEYNRKILEMFFNLYPKAKIIAVGDSAANACRSFGISIDGKVRHPSKGGKSLFIQQLRELID